MTDPVTRSEDVRPEPGTPLPWTADADGYVYGDGGEQSVAYAMTTTYAAYLVYAANKLPELEADRDAYKRATQLCEEHQPGSGSRAECVICGLRELDRALSRIDYLLGEPNEMEVSPYDIHCDPQVVIDLVERREVDRARLVAMLKDVADENVWTVSRECRQAVLRVLAELEEGNR